MSIFLIFIKQKYNSHHSKFEISVYAFKKREENIIKSGNMCPEIRIRVNKSFNK
jgi:hypothetical protein